MSYTMIEYVKDERIATITLNRPEKHNTLRTEMWEELEQALGDANRDHDIRVIILQGAGDAFCSGFDFSGGLEHFPGLGEDEYDPGRDATAVTNPFLGPVPKFMQVWRGLTPVIAKVHGWCVGGGSELALCADIVIASEDAQFGTPYSRVWGCHLTGMWIYRLGLTKAKFYALTGCPVSGKEAAEIGLINFAVPLEELDATVDHWAGRLAQLPATQLASMKLIVNQAFENMGIQSTQYLGPVLDGIMRNTPEGRGFVQTSMEKGVRTAVTERDGPFGDYSQAPPERKPRRKSQL